MLTCEVSASLRGESTTISENLAETQWNFETRVNRIEKDLTKDNEAFSRLESLFRVAVNLALIPGWNLV